jgi:LacI family transcriptional regulator
VAQRVRVHAIEFLVFPPNLIGQLLRRSSWGRLGLLVATAGERIAAAASRPDAIFAANDLVAMGVLQALMMQPSTVRVPHDIALIGYDDIDFAASAVVPFLIDPATECAYRTHGSRDPAGGGGRPLRRAATGPVSPELIVRASAMLTSPSG